MTPARQPSGALAKPRPISRASRSGATRICSTSAAREAGEFIAASGYEIAGPHEEEYLTQPDAKQMKTIIRYPVRPVSA